MKKAHKPKRTKKQLLIEVEQLFDELALLLGIAPQWTVVFHVVDQDENFGNFDARINWPTNYKTAHLSINYTKTHSIPKLLLKKVVLHELLHLVFAPIRDNVDTWFADSAMADELNDKEENVVDSVTGIMMGLMGH